MAKRASNRVFRYNLRLKLAAIEGVRNMYYDYAYHKADRVAELRRDLFNESVEIVSGSDSDILLMMQNNVIGFKSLVVSRKRPFSEPTTYFSKNAL
ncbi:hypothetical protein DPMN_078046 [Dreissena polymorpha]|uniref:Uncharacterized protein n=1 Tax=Dreissena polymorpha TaxID=45954 RepID=A0A9D3YRR6_DREPO|nr:hypothetical protein DPMN_078046 [Dreissena polymorpha]